MPDAGPLLKDGLKKKPGPNCRFLNKRGRHVFKNPNIDTLSEIRRSSK